MIYCMVDPSTTVDVSSNQNSAPTTETAQNSREGSLPTQTSSSNAAVAATTSKTMRRVIDKDGTIKLVPTNDTSSTGDKGFRKGMLALRDMKMHWTCTLLLSECLIVSIYSDVRCFCCRFFSFNSIGFHATRCAIRV